MRKRTLIIVILMLLTGLSLLLYPTVSDYIHNLSYRQAITDYIASVEPMEDQRYTALLAEAQSYNEGLAEKGFTLFPSQEALAVYNGLLNIDSSGIMGYVTVPKVDISLPIYHGTDEGVLQNGVGHLEGSSLPVGGDGTHAVLSAHTGLPSAKLFTNIDQLVVGDTFTVRVLKETLTYEVDQILVVLPNETEALEIQAGADYCTLVTCTPYGVNTHRLLVRGHRVPTPVQEPEEVPETPEEVSPPGNGPLLGSWAWLGALGLVVLLSLTAALIALRQRRMWKQAKRLSQRKNTSQNPPEP